MMDKLDKIQGKNPFKVPENYFDEVNWKILSSVSVEKSPAKQTFILRMRPFLAAAASVAVLVTAAYFSIRLLSHTGRKSDLSELNIPVSTELLLNELDITTIENDSLFSLILTETPDLSNNEIINTLIEENIDITDIYERL